MRLSTKEIGVKEPRIDLLAGSSAGCSPQSTLVLARISHQSSAAAEDALRPAAFSRIGMLDEPTLAPSELGSSTHPPFGRSARSLLSSTTARPSGLKYHWTQRLIAHATNIGEKCGLAASFWFVFFKALSNCGLSNRVHSDTPTTGAATNEKRRGCIDLRLAAV